MKNILTILIFGFLTKNINAQIIEFDKTTIDYGSILFNSNKKRVFKFKNTGKSTLIIKSIYVSCNYVELKVPKKRIEPKENGEIIVLYDTARPGTFSKKISVFSNAINGERKQLRIKGSVKNAK